MRASLLALALVFGPMPGPACAQDAPADTFDTSAARALFQEGVALAHSGDYEAATDRFRRAQALRPSPSVAFNLASALVHGGHLVEAYETFEGVVRDASSTPELVEAAQAQREQVSPRLAWLTLRVDGPGVGVVLDEHPVRAAAINVSIPVDPGPHDIRASRESGVIIHEQLTLAEGESREVVILIPRAADPVPAPMVLAVPVAPVAHGDDGLWIAVGVIAAALAVGAIVTTVVLVTMPSAPTPVEGNTMPAIVTW